MSGRGPHTQNIPLVAFHTYIWEHTIVNTTTTANLLSGYKVANGHLVLSDSQALPEITFNNHQLQNPTKKGINSKIRLDYFLSFVTFYISHRFRGLYHRSNKFNQILKQIIEKVKTKSLLKRYKKHVNCFVIFLCTSETWTTVSIFQQRKQAIFGFKYKLRSLKA